METKYSSKASLFLMELIIAVLFFSISSAICTQMFVKSHVISQQTVNENNTVLWVQNISEVFYSQNGDFSFCKDNFNTISMKPDSSFISTLTSNYEDSFCILFDKNWNTTQDQTVAKYMVLSLYSTDDSFHYIDFITCEFRSELLNTADELSSIKDAAGFVDMLHHKEIWNYSLQIKAYPGMKGADHE